MNVAVLQASQENEIWFLCPFPTSTHLTVGLHMLDKICNGSQVAKCWELLVWVLLFLVSFLFWPSLSPKYLYIKEHVITFIL
jgi:hypothetical protein